MAEPLRENASTTAIAAGVWTLALVALIFFLRAAAQLLIPIVLAVLISYALAPVVDWLVRRRMPRVAATSLLFLVLLTTTGWGVYSLRDDATRAVETLPEAARRAREFLRSPSASKPAAAIRQATEELRGTAGTPPAEGTAPEAGQDPGAQGASPAEPSPPAASSSSGGMGAAAIGFLQQGAWAVFALAGHLMVIVFLVFFLLISGSQVRDRIVEIAGPRLEARRITARVIDDINAQIQRFLLVRLITAVVVGALTWLVLAWMDVGNAAVWGILAGIFNSIPYFGPVIVSGGLLVVGLVQGGGTTQALQMSGAALAITSLEGWLLTPPLMGRAERMSVLTVFLGLLVWTWIWGAWGTILGVPMLVVLKSISDHVEALKPVARLMAP